jgi:prepilin-type N-terminal cleavage/methylation domain-containing protein
MNQKGFTLIEVLAVIAIGGMIMAPVVSMLLQIENGTWQIVGKSIAMTDIDNATHWITRDMPMAQTTSLTDGAPPVTSLTITCNDETGWAASESSVTHSVSYTYSGTQLQRNYDGQVTVVGRHLTNVGFSRSGTTLTVTLTSSGGDVRSKVTRRYSIFMRALIP